MVEEYICPRCNSSNIQNVVASQKTLTAKDYDQLRRVVRQLEVSALSLNINESINNHVHVISVEIHLELFFCSWV